MGSLYATRSTSKELAGLEAAAVPRVVVANSLSPGDEGPGSPGDLPHAVIYALRTASPAHRSTILFNPPSFSQRGTSQRGTFRRREVPLL